MAEQNTAARVLELEAIISGSGRKSKKAEAQAELDTINRARIQAEVDKNKPATTDTTPITKIEGGAVAAAQRRLDNAQVAGDQKKIDMEARNLANAQEKQALDQRNADVVANSPVTEDKATDTSKVPKPETAAPLDAPVIPDNFAQTLGENVGLITNLVKDLIENGVNVNITSPTIQAEIRRVLQDESLSPEAKDATLKNIISDTAVTKPTAEEEKTTKLESELADQSGQDAVDAAKTAKEKGVLTEEEYQKYLKDSIPTPEEKLVEQTSFDYEPPAEVRLDAELTEIADMGYESLGSFIQNIIGDQDLSEMSSAEVNQLLLAQLSIGSTNAAQRRAAELYKTMADRAKQAYDASITVVGTATDEIDKIISGKSNVATTIQSLNVKIAKQQEELGLRSLNAQQDALNAEYEFTYNRMLEQNSRLEGYMKAKLNWMGAADSSAGLTLMNTVIDNAQQRLLLYQTKHTSEMVQLEVTKTGLMSDYFNSVQKQLMDIEGRESEALSAYNDKLDEIDANKIASESEAETRILTTLGSLTSSLYAIGEDQRNWEYTLATDSYNRAVQEAQIAREIKLEDRSINLDTLDRLISASAGLSFGQLSPEMQKQMLDLAELAGLPRSYVSSALSGIQRSSQKAIKAQFSDSDLNLYQQALTAYQAAGAEGTGQSFAEWTASSGTYGSSSLDKLQRIDAEIASLVPTGSVEAQNVDRTPFIPADSGLGQLFGGQNVIDRGRVDRSSGVVAGFQK